MLQTRGTFFWSGALKTRLSLLVCVCVSLSLSHCCDIRSVYIYIYMQVISMVERVLEAILENATPPTQA
jgi:hypothetical protein